MFYDFNVLMVWTISKVSLPSTLKILASHRMDHSNLEKLEALPSEPILG